jgi:hypothetical protein
MADHELEFAAKFGLPEFAGFAARIEARYKRGWETRSTSLLTAAAAAAELEPAQLGAALESNEDASDLLNRALTRAVEVRDPEYVSALGRLVGQALDPARIDEAAFMTAELIRLEPIHLRVLLLAFAYVADGQPVESPSEATVAAAVQAQHPEDDATDMGGEWVAQRLGVSTFAADRAIDRLVTEHLVALVNPKPSPGGRKLMPTEWGGRALLLLFPNLDEVWLGGDSYARR